MNARQRRLVRRQLEGKRDAWLKKQQGKGIVRRVLNLFRKEK